MARQDASHLYGAEHVRSYRETDGELGHDWRNGSSTLLLTTTGHRSGEERTIPLIYGRSGDDYLIVASNGGSPEPPAWFRNLEQRPEVESRSSATASAPAPARRRPTRSPRCGAR